MLGKQGAGKGTQCSRLSHHYVIPHISTGDMFRAAVRSGSAMGRKAKKFMDAGDLIPDDLVNSMVAERLSQHDSTARGFVLDGFPRNTDQAEHLSKILKDTDVDVVIDLEVPTPVVLRRLSSRRVCQDCGTNYSTRSRPKLDWTCDVCGGEVVGREDDTEDAIRRRLDLYERQTAPLIDWYSSRGKLVKVNGVGSPDVVTSRLIRAVDRAMERWAKPG